MLCERKEKGSQSRPIPKTICQLIGYLVIRITKGANSELRYLIMLIQLITNRSPFRRSRCCCAVLTSTSRSLISDIIARRKTTKKFPPSRLRGISGKVVSRVGLMRELELECVTIASDIRDLNRIKKRL
ncbi:hypothetical protein SAY86_001360 [Trapa natans]|uniref:Uncharacterized protein n=1 Tax=Trapa natans TaxID=22666 RepID=A0AAN7MDH5_TRANT|nr:hypothetical protein SAY86_001360 [Trapa natans]